MTKAGRGFGEPLIHSVPVAFLSHSSYLEPNGQVAVNQAIYMLMRRGAELEVAGKHILQREGRGEGTRGGGGRGRQSAPFINSHRPPRLRGGWRPTAALPSDASPI